MTNNAHYYHIMPSLISNVISHSQSKTSFWQTGEFVSRMVTRAQVSRARGPDHLGFMVTWYLCGIWSGFLREAAWACWRDRQKAREQRNEEAKRSSSEIQETELCCGWEIRKNILPIYSPPHLLFPSPKSMRGKNYNALIHSMVLLLSVIGNASKGNDIYHMIKGEYKNIQQQLWNAAASTAEPVSSWIEHSNTTQET